MYIRAFPGGSDCKESACNVGDPGSITGSGKSPGEVNMRVCVIFKFLSTIGYCMILCVVPCGGGVKGVN